jgi:biopolymer transport protein ExbD
MGMKLGPAEEEMSAKADINTTPLVDVMLVMLIIFLVTIPVINKTVKVNLPKAANIATVTKPENITVAIDRNGNIYWNEGLVPDRTRLQELVIAAARQNPQPEVHIRGDSQTRYEAVGRVMYAIQRGGIVKVGFITEPDRGIRGER